MYINYIINIVFTIWHAVSYNRGQQTRARMVSSTCFLIVPGAVCQNSLQFYKKVSRQH